jgi:hypothetical protein
VFFFYKLTKGYLNEGSKATTSTCVVEPEPEIAASYHDALPAPTFELAKSE